MYKDIYGDTRYKVGLHIHTKLSDGRATPEEAAKFYKAAGFDAIAITDHWKFYPEDSLAGLTILSGCEYNTGVADTAENVMHIVGVGMQYAPNLASDATRQEILDGIRAAGGTAILAHPAWSLNTPAEAKALQGFSAVEIYNSVSNTGQSSRPYSGYFVDLLANEGVVYPLVAADDVHYYSKADGAKSYIMVKAENNSQEAILKAIRAGDFYATQGPEVHMHREGDKIIARCSKCCMINFLSNSSWAPNRKQLGENLTYGEYTLRPWDKWVRVEVLDAEGNYGWTNILKL